MTTDLTLILSLISLGFFGGFTHCIGMCGPFVLAQVSNNLQKTSLDNFSDFQRLKKLALLPYHLGRISTYALIGFCCSFLTKNIQDFIGFKILSAIFLTLAALIFLHIFFDMRFSFLGKIRLRFKSRFLENASSFFSKKISVLFLNPKGLKGYLLGTILGFIPCGLLYAAFLITGAFTNPILASFGMIFFGLSTFPSLFLTACGGHVFLKIPELKIVSKVVILFNAITLILIAVKIFN